jgi:hypothetical protein
MLTSVKIVNIFGFIMASMMIVTLAVLTSFNDNNKLVACLALVFIVVCISLHSCLNVSFVILCSISGLSLNP